MNTVLKIAIQKSGRLSENSLRLLKECGIAVDNGLNRLKVRAGNFPLEIFFLRDDDIPQYVEDGVADLGIVGENVLYEKQKNLDIVTKLGFGKCRLSLAIPKDQAYGNLADLEGKRVATSYPSLLKRYMNERNLTVDVHEISGSVEIAPGIGLADAICDLVSSGSTLYSNGLKEVDVVLKSEAVLIAGKNLSVPQRNLLEKLLFRIRAVQNAGNSKYILLNAPVDKVEAVCRILPGMKSPTILPLAEAGWCSIHSVVDEDTFWEVIENLKEEGAQGILVVPIEKMIL